ncbi:UDP-N-acetylmuramoylalanyl-D-glutamate--2,6-diaminopimelate ligase [Nitrosospira multiformis]|uniref:UDP-N-acetylmuramoyl-L-alanyl-D-glutamate--2,6-diaminopimelate ligase n=1 Tax=Nitrosospira multiformis TaxID=1231 RepID=A0A1H8MVC4_9PROT|nr:UDP-N-acetylmuramoyl-L-alanyl-D-glutamate--2,6-diaminopimelate ligase [Nitrosospira multiformis]SEO21210.1 UDP-N-acetylmuramoylalanyl-D-glutamate--2,6-diaminopimelate ligase [Nitrosospira multiformis]
MSSRSDRKISECPGRSGADFDFPALDRLGVRMEHLAVDSRTVKPGDTFLAYRGEKTDGRKFIPQAIERGARAVVWERDGFAWDPEWKTPNLPVSDLKSEAGFIADYLYDHPSQKLWLIGVTGTNGKTSCSHWIVQAMAALDRKAAVIGTLGAGFPEEMEFSANTTPDSVLLQAKIANFLRRGAECVAMEVSSHGIVQGRINGATFAVAMLTNLSRDHLDYHGTMEVYAAAKARLFHWSGLKYAVLNLDDVFGMQLLHDLEGTGIGMIGYGFTDTASAHPNPGSFRRVWGRNLRASMAGLEFDIEFEGECLKFKTQVLGSFNASNLLGVLATLLASGIAFPEAVRALQKIQPVAGRMQQIGGEGDEPLIVVDYAHTPDAMEKVLTTLREAVDGGFPAGKSETGSGRLVCVFGCGGERDQGKRPLMGEVATRLADEAIITSDNPRSEDPDSIIRDIAVGAAANHRIEKDRAGAIHRAIQGAHKGDVILIAGKGHETWQEAGGKKFPFSDAEVARRALMTEKAQAQI